MANKLRPFRFSPEELQRWQAAADGETGGNLTEWIRRRCNAAAPDVFEGFVRESLEKLLRRRKKKDVPG